MTSLIKDQIAEVLVRWFQNRLRRSVSRVTLLDGPATSGFSSETLFARAEFDDGEAPLSRDVAIRVENPEPGLFLHGNFQLQWRMIDSMASHTNIPVPAPIGYEPDPSILGTPFSVVSKIAGRVAPQIPNYNLAGWIFDLPCGDRERLWRNALEALAAIHRVDWQRGFSFLDQPEYGRDGLDQLLHRVEEWYDWSRRGRVHPAVVVALERLRRFRPAKPHIGVLWGDAAPNNMIFGEDLTVAAVLDWEAAALGPAEADLAWWLFYDDYLSNGLGIARLPGLPDRQSSIEIYETALGRAVQSLEYYELLAHTRNAILSMRSVNRQVERGFIEPDTTAVTHNPISRMLAVKLGIDPPEVGDDYAKYLRAVIGQKTAAPMTPESSVAIPTVVELLSPKKVLK